MCGILSRSAVLALRHVPVRDSPAAKTTKVHLGTGNKLPVGFVCSLAEVRAPVLKRADTRLSAGHTSSSGYNAA
jgi:hypothetical protein